jgi:hypothetical protein
MVYYIPTPTELNKNDHYYTLLMFNSYGVGKFLLLKPYVSHTAIRIRPFQGRSLNNTFRLFPSFQHLGFKKNRFKSVCNLCAK